MLAILGWASLLGSVAVNLGRQPDPITLGAVGCEVWRLLQYFTILTNIIMATAMSCVAWTAWDLRGRWLGGVALYAAMLALLYHFLLGGSHGPMGWRLVIDLSHHYVLPLAVVAFWLLYGAKRKLGPLEPLVWLGYPVGYLVYMLVRGHCTARYPYAVVDPVRQGTTRLCLHCALIATGFLIGGGLLVLVTRWRGRLGVDGGTGAGR